MAVLGRTMAGAASAEIELDVETLIGSHMVIQANAGGGKSRTIRKVLELSTGIAQRIVIDVEDEFYTLREAAPNLILAGGDNGDCPATTANAADLARFILETGVDAVVQINDLGLEVRRQFVRLFLESIIDAPRSLWHPALVVLDEADRYAPQDGSASSLSAVVALMAQGRKRGFTGILASQRNAKLNKDATGDVNNWLLGRVGQSTDRRTVADALGFKPSDPEARGLLQLKPGHFWGFGPAISPEPVLLHIGPVATTHLLRGQTNVPTPPAPAAISAMLGRLHAAAQADDGKPGTEPKAVPPPPAIDVEAIRAKAYLEGVAEGRRDILNQIAPIVQSLVDMKGLGDVIDIATVRPLPAAPPVHSGPGIERVAAKAAARRQPVPAQPGDKLHSAASKILGVLSARHPVRFTWGQIGILAGLTASGGHWNSGVRQLRDLDLIYEDSGKVGLSDAGIDRTGGALPPVQSPAEILQMWCSRLPSPAPDMLRYLVERPGTASVAELAGGIGKQPTGGHWNSGLSILRGNGLIEQIGRGQDAMLRASDMFFEGVAA